MAQASDSDPVRRKIRSAVTGATGPLDEREGRIWRQVGARALKAAVGMNVQVSDVTKSAIPPDELSDVAGQHDMTALMENDAGDVGLALVDPEVVAAIVERQTIGTVADRPVVPRRATTVDGALVSPALDRILALAATALGDHGLRDPCTDYRFAMMTETGTPPTLALADLLHTRLSLEFRIEGGRRTGRLSVVVPDTGASEEQRALRQADWSDRMENAVLGSDVLLEARLGQLRLSIEQVMALQVGETVPLTRDDLDNVRLVAAQGHTIAKGRLGRISGFRAVKIIKEDAQDGPAWEQVEIASSRDV